MEKYQLIQKAGSGNFSEVYKARNMLTDQTVAIKQMKNTDEIQELLMRELKIAAALDHPNVIKLKQIIKNHRDIRVVFEYMEENLLELYTSAKLGINEHQLRCILYQSALGLEYLHRNRIIHRDIKPENILINRKTALIKLIDFGLAKEEFTAETDYVATRWYRSPENLIGLKKSTVAIDIFALGCVAVQLFTLTPLFPGTNTIDQLSKMFAVLGTPTFEDWSRGYNELRRKNYNFGIKHKVGIGCVMPNASNELVDLLDKMLQMNPQKRITAREMLFHPFFNNIERVIPQHVWREAQRIKDDIKRRDKSNNSVLVHKNMDTSPVRKLTPYDNYFYSKDRKPVDVAGVNVQPRNCEQIPMVHSINLEDPQKKVFNSGLHLDRTNEKSVKAQPRPQKRLHYLNIDTQAPTQLIQNKLQHSRSHRMSHRSPTNIGVLQVPTERGNILDRASRNSRGPYNNIVLAAEPAQISRIMRNHSLINESNLLLNKSVERTNMDLHKNRSVPKVASTSQGTYFSSLHPNYKIKVNY